MNAVTTPTTLSGLSNGNLFTQLKSQIPVKSSHEVAASFEAPKDTFIQGSIGGGIKRMVKMSLLRPRGWAELALHFCSFGTTAFIFPVKHFIEGLVGVDSLYFKRSKFLYPLNISGAVSHNRRTLWEALTGQGTSKAE